MLVKTVSRVDDCVQDRPVRWPRNHRPSSLPRGSHRWRSDGRGRGALGHWRRCGQRALDDHFRQSTTALGHRHQLGRHDSVGASWGVSQSLDAPRDVQRGRTHHRRHHHRRLHGRGGRGRGEDRCWADRQGAHSLDPGRVCRAVGLGELAVLGGVRFSNHQPRVAHE